MLPLKSYTSARDDFGNQDNSVHTCTAKTDLAVSSATEPSVFAVSLNRLTPEARGGAKGDEEAWDTQADTVEAEEQGHLPDYVSVTSKKEERRDTWSESDKSVEADIIRNSSKTEGAQV